ncbi:DUF2207 domain-containing protein [Ferdinandcohnia quinoae]|uniref:DUF2207 domain-containing protein n=1 Tax=Fredinandcohnia quinoae TaxID=2918902 RepID=A0AAW5ECG0_9BACI|nr:DUF2207 domain-containing protein [Fredinandcohnia sp. SECRCQ15]MCH1627741.1 DUF2207 domain-containing protein [Fredinandcohnia sp. SECRCQ15]
MKRIYVFTIFVFMGLLWNASLVDARSFSIDKVHIRAWIQPNGDLRVNEVFAYTFDGEYSRVSRSVHLDGHKGINKFEAYELLNQDGVPGFIDMSELRPLEVNRDNNTFSAKLPARNETKYAFYYYELKNAVRSYDTFSDLTIPFFGEGQNHSVDLQNLTIDLVFPEPVNVHDYHAFIHDPNGELTERTEELVSFHTPVSKKEELTEVRLLFPSSIMIDQNKQAAPVSLERVLEEEDNLLHDESVKIKSQSKLVRNLYAITILFTAIALGLMFLPQRILRGSGNRVDLKTYDPLHLYVIDRAGKRDNLVFFAGILSLVEKGLITISHTKTPTRFAWDAKAPISTLSFSFRRKLKKLSDHEITFLVCCLHEESVAGSGFFR